MRTYILLLIVVIPFASFCQQKKDITTEQHSTEQATGLELYNTALAAYDKESYDSAIVYLTQSLDLIPRKDSFYAQALHMRSFVYTRAGNLEMAVTDLQQLVQLQPATMMYWIDLSYALGEAHRYAECLDRLEQARCIDSSHVSIYLNLSYYSGQSGAYANAIRYAKMGLSLAKDTPLIASLMNNLGYAQAKTGSVRDGLNTISSSLRLWPQNSFAYFNLGRIFLEIQDKEQACANFMKARDLGGIILTEEYIASYCK